MNFMGYVKQSEVLSGVLLIVNSNGSPVAADALPTWRTYGPSGQLTNGTCSKLDSGSDIIAASNENLIEIETTAAHGLTTGTYVLIAGVLGNTAANGSWFITEGDNANKFTLDGSVGNGVYTSGGTYEVQGAYRWSVDAESADGFAVGSIYYILFNYEVSSTAMGQAQSFFVT